jgi:hypothetical protein
MKSPANPKAKRNARIYRLNPGPPAPKVAPATSPTPAVVLQADRLIPMKTLWPRPQPQPLHPTEFPTAAPGKSVIKLGLDLDVQHITATIQWDHLNPKPARQFESAAALVALGQETDR